MRLFRHHLWVKGSPSPYLGMISQTGGRDMRERMDISDEGIWVDNHFFGDRKSGMFFTRKEKPRNWYQSVKDQDRETDEKYNVIHYIGDLCLDFPAGTLCMDDVKVGFDG